MSVEPTSLSPRSAILEPRPGRASRRGSGVAGILVPLLLMAAAITFALGVTLPLVRFERLYFLSDTPSLVSLLLSLWEEGAVWLAGVVFAFSFVFPLVKMFVTFQAAFHPEGRLPRWTGALAKWSMMDVLLVAIVVFAAKTSGLAEAMAQPGIWFYGASVLSLAAGAALLNRARRNGYAR